MEVFREGVALVVGDATAEEVADGVCSPSFFDLIRASRRFRIISSRSLAEAVALVGERLLVVVAAVVAVLVELLAGLRVGVLLLPDARAAEANSRLS